jgi:hypothetical protein
MACLRIRVNWELAVRRAAARLRTPERLRLSPCTLSHAGGGSRSTLLNIPKSSYQRHIQPPQCLSDGSYELNYLCANSLANATRSMPQSSYYDQQNRPTAALYRARQPYLIRNIFTGMVLLGFVGGVCMCFQPRISGRASN